MSEVTTVQASAVQVEANLSERTISGLLVPYGEISRPKVGPAEYKVRAGALKLPTDLSEIKLNRDHDQLKPVGKAIAAEERPNGLYVTFRVAKTTSGNDLMVEAEEGLRASLSAEFSFTKAEGIEVTEGVLTGAAAVIKGGSPSAKIHEIKAADSGTTPEKETPMETNSETVEATEAVSVVQAAPVLAAGSVKAELGAITFDAIKRGSDVQAALADQLTTHDAGKVYIGDQEIGELFKARKNERKLVNAVGVKPLTSLFVTGTKKDRTFAVANWAGNKVELPTGNFTTSRENWQASAKAVAVDIAMELVEFGDASVISDLYEQAVESYIVQTEAELLTFLLSNSTAVTGLTSAIAAIDKASETLGNIGANMDFIAVAPNVMALLRSVTSANAPWWLASQGAVNLRDRSIDLGGVTLTSNPALANGTILVGDKRAVDYRESKEFRYQAANIAQGGVDISLIKFRAQKVTDTGAILKLTGVTGA